jgi:hypothetical protein
MSQQRGWRPVEVGRIIIIYSVANVENLHAAVGDNADLPGYPQRERKLVRRTRRTRIGRKTKTRREKVPWNSCGRGRQARLKPFKPFQ